MMTSLVSDKIVGYVSVSVLSHSETNNNKGLSLFIGEMSIMSKREGQA